MLPSEKIWKQISTDAGTTYKSIPTKIPEKWIPMEILDPSTSSRTLPAYVCGEYEIRRFPYGQTSHSYTVYRQGEVIGRLYGRLKDAKARAQCNARGEDVIHFAEKHVKRG